MAYFKRLPDVLYPSLKKDISSFDYIKIKNLFKRAKLRDDFLNVFSAFEKYSIVGDERPDSVSEKIYKDPQYDWLVLITNNIQNVRTDWPMSQSDLSNFLTEKYTEQQLVEIHHYETREVRNSLGELVLPGNLIVDSKFTFKYADAGATTTYSSLVSVSNFEYENYLNEEKRNIFILRPEFVRVVEKDLKRIFKYEQSSEFVDQRTIKTYNPRFS